MGFRGSGWAFGCSRCRRRCRRIWILGHSSPAEVSGLDRSLTLAALRGRLRFYTENNREIANRAPSLQLPASGTAGAGLGVCLRCA
jgi:hypothetical protein